MLVTGDFRPEILAPTPRNHPRLSTDTSSTNSSSLACRRRSLPGKKSSRALDFGFKSLDFLSGLRALFGSSEACWAPGFKAGRFGVEETRKMQHCWQKDAYQDNDRFLNLGFHGLGGFYESIHAIQSAS